MPDKELRELFSRNLNAYLSERGYSQADLARHMHASTASTAKWCTGQSIPRIDKIQSSWIYKDMPKTAQSIRTVKYSKDVIQMLGIGAPDAYVIGLNPNMITRRFCRLRDKLGIGIRFHDLRAYAASVMMSIGIPRTYIEEAGGWKHGSTVLDEHYLRTFESKKDDFSQQTAEYFRMALRAHEKAHDIAKSE